MLAAVVLKWETIDQSDFPGYAVEGWGERENAHTHTHTRPFH